MESSTKHGQHFFGFQKIGFSNALCPGQRKKKIRDAGIFFKIVTLVYLSMIITFFQDGEFGLA